jgi:uncharacterized membrane protein
MNRSEFLTELDLRLTSLPQAEREKSLAYYDEIINDRIEDGMTEEQAVSCLGETRKIAEQIIMDTPMSVLVGTKVKRKKPGILVIILLVLGFPLWFPLLISAAVVVLSIYISIWSVNIGLWASVAGFGAGTIGALIVTVVSLFTAGFGDRLLSLGGALACAGLAVLMFYVSLAVSKFLINITVKAWRRLKMSFAVKEGEKVE